MKKNISLLLLLLSGVFISTNLAAQEDPPSNEPFEGTQPAAQNLNDIWAHITYPEVAKEAGIEGTVVLRVLVDETGTPVRYMTLKSPHPILTKAVTDKVMQLRFTPGIENGKAAKVWVTIPFSFQLIKTWPTYPDQYTITNTGTELTLQKDKECEEEFLPHAIDLTGQLQEMENNGLPSFTGKERTLACRLEISTTGTVERVIVSKHANDAFEEQVAQYLRTFRWTPGKACGTEVPSTVKLTLVFEK